MSNKLLIARFLRIVFALIVIIWGILMWKNLPEQIPVHFDAALAPDDYELKKCFVWIFLFAFAALLPVPKDKIEEKEEKDVKELDDKRDKYATILNWAHTAFMCTIFIVVMVLVKKNLR